MFAARVPSFSKLLTSSHLDLFPGADQPDEGEPEVRAGAVDAVPPRLRRDQRLPDGGEILGLQAAGSQWVPGGGAAAGGKFRGE